MVDDPTSHKVVSRRHANMRAFTRSPMRRNTVQPSDGRATIIFKECAAFPASGAHSKIQILLGLGLCASKGVMILLIHRPKVFAHAACHVLVRLRGRSEHLMCYRFVVGIRAQQLETQRAPCESPTAVASSSNAAEHFAPQKPRSRPHQNLPGFFSPTAGSCTDSRPLNGSGLEFSCCQVHGPSMRLTSFAPFLPCHMHKRWARRPLDVLSRQQHLCNHVHPFQAVQCVEMLQHAGLPHVFLGVSEQVAVAVDKELCLCILPSRYLQALPPRPLSNAHLPTLPPPKAQHPIGGSVLALPLKILCAEPELGKVHNTLGRRLSFNIADCKGLRQLRRKLYAVEGEGGAGIKHEESKHKERARSAHLAQSEEQNKAKSSYGRCFG